MTPCLWKAARLSLLATLLWGCAILPPGAEPLQVTLSDVRLVDATLLEQTYRLRLRLLPCREVTCPGLMGASSSMPFLAQMASTLTW